MSNVSTQTAQAPKLIGVVGHTPVFGKRQLASFKTQDEAEKYADWARDTGKHTKVTFN